jgi:kinesin family protein 18/19
LRHNTNEPIFLGDGSFASASQEPSLASRGNGGLRSVINVVDDKMLIFDPPEGNPMTSMQKAAFPGKNTNRIREHRFVFDRLFDEGCTQDDVFTYTSKPLIDHILDGYNATVFAYGATGCGKTHTISGTPEQPGIIFLTMKELFERIEALQDTNVVDVSLSYLEIYNETIRDLLQPNNNHKSLILREDAEKRISVSNLSSHRPQTVEEVMDMILQGNQNRTMSPTEANATSSRSHAVLQINVTQRSRTAELSEAHTFATFSMIDLAGSERAAATKNRGSRLLEGANINKSLLALGNCINALCDPRQKNHVPYRDSKLTRLLKFSLGGNCKTVMIVCVSPSSAHYDETLNTLKYADRAKKIKTKVVRNEHNLDRHVGSYLKMITEQRAEIEELRNRESKSIEQALAKHQKAREGVHAAMHEALSSLETTIEKTQESRQQRSKCMARLRSLANQISQLEMWLNAINKVIDDNYYDEVNHEEFTRIETVAKQLMAKLTQEQDSLQQYCESSLQDEFALDSAIGVLSRRLQETNGWTEEDSAAFDAHAQTQKIRCENQLLQNALTEIPIAGSLKSMSELYFTMMSKLFELRGAREEVIYERVKVMFDEMVQNCINALDSTEFNNSTLTQDIQKLLENSKPPPPPPPQTTQGSSTKQPSSAFKRPAPTTKRHTVIIRSPIPANKKPSKRVRWEDDDSGNSSTNSPPQQVVENIEPSTSPARSDSSMGSPPPPPADPTPAPAPASAPQSASFLADTTLEGDSTMNTSVMSDTAGSAAKKGKRFGVKSELKRKQPFKTSSALAMNKKGVGRVEKENQYDMFGGGDSGGSPARRLGQPLRLAGATVSSAMKQVPKNENGKS